VRRRLDCTIATQRLSGSLDSLELLIFHPNNQSSVATTQHRIAMVQQKEVAPLRFMN
jgi:hypothetical protein